MDQKQEMREESIIKRQGSYIISEKFKKLFSFTLNMGSYDKLKKY